MESEIFYEVWAEGSDTNPRRISTQLSEETSMRIRDSFQAANKRNVENYGAGTRNYYVVRMHRERI